MSYTEKINTKRGYIQDVLGAVGATCTKGLSHPTKPFNISETTNYSVQVVKPLRICRVCGLQAFTENDLKLFKKQKNLPYGRATWCKKCCAKYARNRYPPKKMKEALDNLEHPSYCYFCGKEITKFKGLKGDCITVHSLDGNHNNWDKYNKVPAHRHCHSEFHSPSKDPEVSKKISEALTGIKRSDETKRKMSAAKTPEIRQKLRIKMTGSKNPMWKGDEASDQAKYQREQRRKRREQNEYQ